MIAVDPGASGGIAFHRLGVASNPVFAMPKTDREVVDLLAPQFVINGETVYLEGTVKYAGTAMPGSAGIVYGDNCGFVRGVLTAFKYKIIIVPPKAWQKALGLGNRKNHASKTAWKNHLKNRAEQLFPSIRVTLATADALLILEAARRGLIG